MNKLTLWTVITIGATVSGALVAMDDKKNNTILRITTTKEELYRHVLMTDNRYQKDPRNSKLLSFLTIPPTNPFIPREAFEYANHVIMNIKTSDEHPFAIHEEYTVANHIKGWSEFCTEHYERIKSNTATTQEKEDFLVIGGNPLSRTIKAFYIEQRYPHFLAQVAALEKTIKLEDFNAERLY
jgi:hypothetical protein